MCGRFTLRSPLARVAEIFELGPLEDWAARARPRFNIAPSQSVIAIRTDAETGRPALTQLTWGLVPHWADDPAIGSRMINARAESIATKPAFRDAFRHRRCLVVADGFYEWRKDQRAKQPYYIRLKQDRPFAFAGLWERWGTSDVPLETCTIVTTEANALLQPLHDRMPVILDRERWQRWLDPANEDRQALEALLRPYWSDEMLAYPVTSLVNSPKHDAAECIAPTTAAKRQSSLFD